VVDLVAGKVTNHIGNLRARRESASPLNPTGWPWPTTGTARVECMTARRCSRPRPSS
jgi:hypothetical protein